MAKFGINDIIDIKSKSSRTDEVNEYKEIWLNPYEVKPSDSNFYAQENIEELADSFLAVRQQQPTVSGKVDGQFWIVSGHRRNRAKRLKEALLRAKKEDGLKIQGKLRDVVAGLMNESGSEEKTSEQKKEEKPVEKLSCTEKAFCHKKILREWENPNLGITHAAKKVSNAIKNVSETNPL